MSKTNAWVMDTIETCPVCGSYCRNINNDWQCSSYYCAYGKIVELDKCCVDI